MGLSMTVYKDKQGKEELDEWKPGWDVQEPLIKMSTEGYNGYKEKCNSLSCLMCDCSHEHMYKIDKPTGVMGLDVYIKKHGFVWISFDF